MRTGVILVLMGVSGCGKTTIGALIAEMRGWRFQEGDALHPPSNVAKMHGGVPLDDRDRAPWLCAIAAVIDDWRERGEAGVVACSALKRRYRNRIIGRRAGVVLVYLKGSQELIEKRLAARHGHFMPSTLLVSQFAALEEPGPDERPIVACVAPPPAVIARSVLTELTARDGGPKRSAGP